MKHIYKIIILTLLLNGCYYTFSDKPFPQIKTIYVTPFQNNTSEYELAAIATEKLTEKIENSSSYSISTSDECNGIITSTITNYERKVNTFDEYENPIDFIIRIKAKVTLTEKNTDKKLFEENYEGLSTFPSGSDEMLAAEKAIDILVDNIYDKLKGG